jgi:Ca2+-binding EF-hand superfamily protein
MVNNSTNILLIFYFNLDLKIVFSLFDSNHDGKIAKEEINELVSFIAGDIAKEEDVIQFMQAIDTNRKYCFFFLLSCLSWISI